MSQSTHPRIAIAFYGIPRSLGHTHASIQSKLILPSHEKGHCDIFCHFFDQRTIHNTRTNEYTALNPDEWKLLKPTFSQIDSLDETTERDYLEKLKPYGNAWEDDWQSLRNILRQLISLQRVSKLIEAHGMYDYVVFARPDMEYHDLLDWDDIKRRASPATIAIPHWQWSGGLNDRFAVCGADASKYYSNRLQLALDYCQKKHRPMHSERLLFYTLMHSPTRLRTLPMRATRVRSNGDRALESFSRVKIAKLVEAHLACNVYPRYFARSNWTNAPLRTQSAA